MKKYRYSGPVYYFNKQIDPCWSGFTSATSEAKAKSNLTFQFKKQHGYMPNAKINIVGGLIQCLN